MEATKTDTSKMNGTLRRLAACAVVSWMGCVEARDWTNIVEVNVPDQAALILGNLDPFILSGPITLEAPVTSASAIPTHSPVSSPSAAPAASPSATPSASPSASPTSAPTSTPNSSPTKSPTRTPSAPPTIAPTSLPVESLASAPTSSPSTAPTEVSEEVEALYNDISYFDYNTSPAARKGPGNPDKKLRFMHNATHRVWVLANNQWDNVYHTPATDYWNEFVDIVQDTTTNQCGNYGQQSPINVVDSGAICHDHHEVRTRPGDLRIEEETNITKQILPNKLRLVMHRRPRGQIEPDPPNADFPHKWGGRVDALNVDVKMPSEHWIEGKQYPAEYQIYHVHRKRQRSVAISVMIDIGDKTNRHFQKALDEWQNIFDADVDSCEQNNWARRNRRMLNQYHPDNRFPILDETEMQRLRSLKRLDNTKANNKVVAGKWDPYRKNDILTTIWFFGYDGSLTEPPCSEWVSWRVYQKPFYVSEAQMQQMRTLLFDHVDPVTCQPTSIGYNNSVARPLQDSAHREVYKCNSTDFVSDAEKDIKRAQRPSGRG